MVVKTKVFIRKYSENEKYTINLHYIRAAIEANVGIRLSLEETRQALIDAELITQEQAQSNAQIFSGYSEFYKTEYAETDPHVKEAEEIIRELQTTK